MQSTILLVFAALFVYLLFSRKGGMGCCGGHGAHGGAQPDRERHAKELSTNREGHIIDLAKDQYTVLPTEEHMQSKVADRVVSEKVR